ncbi:SDR family oxidoreductase [Mucilaginibacter sp. CAU 1740]|uniref:SDR family oxidoreductase n=1 Tax=Mucilaginibacter sp. CAU 1740 TaxID=3140365 RepID=UPI00325ADDCC
MKKTVLITGASSGFGKEAALLFHGRGWNVIATMRSPEKETELSAMPDVLVEKLDVTDEQSIKAAVKIGIEHFGQIDVLVNNAGYALIGVFESATAQQISDQYQVNVFGLMSVTQAVLPVMRKQKSGIIVNISSFGGVTAGQFSSLYNSSKFAVEGFSEALSHELAFLNIGVKIIEPGSVGTNFRNGMTMINNQITDYNGELAALMQRYTSRTGHLAKATAGDVANTIYQAATDGSAQLRYVVGEDAAFYIGLKQEYSEAAWVEIMRS